MSELQPLISVLIPVYNVEDFVKEAIQSILSQTYKNIEIIVVDDCSTDNTYKIVHDLSRLDQRIKLYRNPINSKIVKTLNFALTKAKGEFVARMDGDDISAPERLEKQLKFLLDNPNFDLVGCHLTTINEEGEIIGSQKMPISQNVIKKTIKLVSPVSHIWLARKKVYDLLNGYRDIPGAEDYDFLLRMYSEGLLFTNLNSFEYFVRIRNGNTMSTIGFNQKLMSNYIVDLYNQRKSIGIDDFSAENVACYIVKYEKHKDNFDKSNKFFISAFKANKERNFISMFFYLSASILISKFQMQYLLKRILFKFYSKG